MAYTPKYDVGDLVQHYANPSIRIKILKFGAPSLTDPVTGVVYGFDPNDGVYQGELYEGGVFQYVGYWMASGIDENYVLVNDVSSWLPYAAIGAAALVTILLIASNKK